MPDPHPPHTAPPDTTSPDDDRDPIAIYRATVGPLYASVLRRAGGSHELAEDVTQETYMRFIRQCRDGKPPQPALPWLHTVARNLLLNHYRRRRPESVDQTALDRALANSNGSAESHDAHETIAAIQWGLGSLRRGPSRLLEAFHLEGRSVAAIAAETGLSERAVEGRLRRARESLRKILRPITRDCSSSDSPSVSQPTQQPTQHTSQQSIPRDTSPPAHEVES